MLSYAERSRGHSPRTPDLGSHSGFVIVILSVTFGRLCHRLRTPGTIDCRLDHQSTSLYRRGRRFEGALSTGHILVLDESESLVQGEGQDFPELVKVLLDLTGRDTRGELVDGKGI